MQPLESYWFDRPSGHSWGNPNGAFSPSLTLERGQTRTANGHLELTPDGSSGARPEQPGHDTSASRRLRLLGHVLSVSALSAATQRARPPAPGPLSITTDDGERRIRCQLPGGPGPGLRQPAMIADCDQLCPHRSGAGLAVPFLEVGFTQCRPCHYSPLRGGPNTTWPAQRTDDPWAPHLN